MQTSAKGIHRRQARAMPKAINLSRKSCHVLGDAAPGRLAGNDDCGGRAMHDRDGNGHCAARFRLPGKPAVWYLSCGWECTREMLARHGAASGPVFPCRCGGVEFLARGPEVRRITTDSFEIGRASC